MFQYPATWLTASFYSIVLQDLASVKQILYIYCQIATLSLCPARFSATHACSLSIAQLNMAPHCRITQYHFFCN